MHYSEAAKIAPGDSITYQDGDALLQAVVTGPVHTFIERGMVVYAPIEGGYVVNTRIVSVERA